jgi:hypothetical protein
VGVGVDGEEAPLRHAAAVTVKTAMLKIVRIDMMR